MWAGHLPAPEAELPFYLSNKWGTVTLGNKLEYSSNIQILIQLELQKRKLSLSYLMSFAQFYFYCDFYTLRQSLSRINKKKKWEVWKIFLLWPDHSRAQLMGLCHNIHICALSFTCSVLVLLEKIFMSRTTTTKKTQIYNIKKLPKGFDVPSVIGEMYD